MMKTTHVQLSPSTGHHAEERPEEAEPPAASAPCPPDVSGLENAELRELKATSSCIYITNRTSNK